MALDRAGAAYVTGLTDSTDFPVTARAFDRRHNGAEDVYVAKVTPGGLLGYATFVGGSGIDAAFGLEVDPTGNAYVTGETDSLDFPTTRHAFDRTFNGGLFDAVGIVLDTQGSRLRHSSYVGGSGDEERARRHVQWRGE